VLRIDNAGRTRRIYVKRRDLLRANGLQPRDLRRIDPSQSLTKTSPNITVKENVLLTNLGGVRWGAASSSTTTSIRVNFKPRAFGSLHAR
jgi:hypothetical protein